MLRFWIVSVISFSYVWTKMCWIFTINVSLITVMKHCERQLWKTSDWINFGILKQNGKNKTFKEDLLKFKADLKLKLFLMLWASTSSHICYPIRLVFYQHLNLHIAWSDSLAEPSNHTRGQFLRLPSYSLHLRLLWSKSDNKVTRKRIHFGFWGSKFVVGVYSVI